jgi:hypothetical protein
MKFWAWVTGVFVVVFGVAAWLMHAFTKAELRDYITLAAVGIACVAWVQASRSANAATKTAALAELNEERKRYGWAIAVHPDGDRYVLRNSGTLLARDVKLVADDHTFVQFEQHDGDQGPDIPPGQSKAFSASFTMMSSPGNEIQIDWQPDGEKQRQRHNEVLEPIPNKVFEETVKRREVERAAEAAAAERFFAETRRLLLDLADAWGAYKEDASPRNKIRVQALVAAVPGNMAKEIGYEADVLRDLWGPHQWPLDVFVADPKDKKLVRENAPMIELMWNLMQVQLPEIVDADNSQSPMGWFRIEHAVSGYVELVRNRESGKRELLDGPRDRKTRADAKKHVADMHRQSGVEPPRWTDDEP